MSSVSRRTTFGVVGVLLVLLVMALVAEYQDISRSSLEAILHKSPPPVKDAPLPVEKDASVNTTSSDEVSSDSKFWGRISRMHYLIPTTLVKPPVCAVVASALVNRYPIPVLVGYKAKGDFDAKKAHIAKLRAITRYLRGPAAGADDDLVVVVDGFDVLAQIPAETTIQRYFDLTAAADRRLADQRGLTVEELHSRGLRQTILWGTDKGCFPSGGDDEKNRDPRCWLVPFSTLPRYVWGPETGSGPLPFSDSRYANSGTVIGPLGDLRAFIDATLQLIEDTWDADYKYRNSDQYYVSTLYARQEYQRTLDLNGGTYPGGAKGRKFPEPKRDDDDVTEYHAFLDTDYAITQTQCHNDKFLRKLQFNNHDRTATVEKADKKKGGAHAAPYTIQMPAPLYQGLRRLFESLFEDERPAATAREWISGLHLRTNTATRHIYAFYHNTCSKKAFVDKFYDSWFFPVLRPLLRAAVRAIQDETPIHPRAVDGRIWMPAHRYPEYSVLEDELGGVFTDLDGDAFIPLQKLCVGDAAPVIGGEKKEEKKL